MFRRAVEVEATTRAAEIQEYFRRSQVPLLATWDAGVQIFIAAGAEAF